jgi:hypothetical protein
MKGVPVVKAEDIIRSVAGWCKVKVGRLPSADTAKAFRSELNGVTLLQLADTFGELKKDATLQQDDTSKFHQGYSAFEVCYTENGKQRVLTVGL